MSEKRIIALLESKIKELKRNQSEESKDIWRNGIIKTANELIIKK